jgi:hypothetical protein
MTEIHQTDQHIHQCVQCGQQLQCTASHCDSLRARKCVTCLCKELHRRGLRWVHPLTDEPLNYDDVELAGATLAKISFTEVEMRVLATLGGTQTQAKLEETTREKHRLEQESIGLRRVIARLARRIAELEKPSGSTRTAPTEPPEAG